MKLKLAVLLTALVFGGVALSQTTLGNMFQFGQSTTANLPASSATIRGAMLFNLDAGAPVFNDGTAWKQLIDTSTLPATPAQFWEDAGAGYIYADESIRNPDGGQALNVWGTIPIAFPQVKPADTVWLAARETTFGQDWVSMTLADRFDPATANVHGRISGAQGQVATVGSAHYGVGLTLSAPKVGFASADWGYLTGYFDSAGATGTGRLIMETTTGNNAIQLTTGARVDLGGAASDYIYSDGLGVKTPQYFMSALTFATGVGIIGTRVQASGGAADAFTAAAAATGDIGTLGFDSTSTVMQVQKSAGAFAPIAQPHLIHDRQTFSTRIFGVTKNMYPEIAERISCDSVGGSGATMQMYWLGAAAATTTFTSSTRRGIGLVSTDNAPVYGTTACSSAASTQYLPVAGLNSAFCQVVETSSSVATMTIMALMSNYVPSNGNTTLTSQAYGFKYSSGIGANWYACYYDGAETCASTGVAAAVSSQYVLCARDNAQATTDFFINGVHVHRAAGAANLSNGAPIIWVDLSAGAPNGILAGGMQVETE